jgi:hypothetical protein
MLMRLLALLLLALLPVGARAQGESPTPTPPPDVRRLRVESMGRFQMEVWINAKRAGFTPLEVNLRPGKYLVTAAAESVVPVIQALEIGDEHPVLWLPTVPLTRDNYDKAGEHLVRAIIDFPGNPHFVIMSMLMVRDAEDATQLLERAARELPGDPMADLLRAKIILRQNKLDEALQLVDRAVPKLASASIAWRIRAMVLLARGELDPALDAANQSVVLDPRGWRNLRIRARVHAARGDTAKARADEELAQELYEQVHQIMESARRP